MWNTACSNRICFTKDKTNEQNLHLNRLLCTRPKINVTEPYVPTFLKINSSQKEKKKQIQNKKNKENDILQKKILNVYFKNGKYSRYEVEPKQIYPAFRRYTNLKFDEIVRLININTDNQKFENKISNLKSIYDNGEMMKEAEKQEKYLNNLLNRPKSIPFTPALKFKSIEYVRNWLKNQFIRQQQYLNEYQNTNSGNSRRGNSARKMRTSTNASNNKMNKSLGEKNKSENKTNRSQSSKNRKSLKINNDHNNEDEENKKSKKETGTTKTDTAVKK